MMRNWWKHLEETAGKEPLGGGSRLVLEPRVLLQGRAGQAWLDAPTAKSPLNCAEQLGSSGGCSPCQGLARNSSNGWYLSDQRRWAARQPTPSGCARVGSQHNGRRMNWERKARSGDGATGAGGTERPLQRAHQLWDW